MQGYPSPDTTQNWFLIGGSESDGWTTLEFWRYLDTGDTVSDRVISKVCKLFHSPIGCNKLILCTMRVLLYVCVDSYLLSVSHACRETVPAVLAKVSR